MLAFLFGVGSIIPEEGEGGAKKDLKPRYHRESTFMLLAVTEKMQLCIPDAFF